MTATKIISIIKIRYSDIDQVDFKYQLPFKQIFWLIFLISIEGYFFRIGIFRIFMSWLHKKWKSGSNIW